MNIHNIGLSIALDQEKEDGLDIMARFAEKLKILSDESILIDQLFEQIDKLDKKLIDIDIASNDESYIKMKINLVLSNLGKSLLNEEPQDFIRNKHRFKNLINYMFALNEVVDQTEYTFDISSIEHNLSFFEFHNSEFDKQRYFIIQNAVKQLYTTGKDDEEIIRIFKEDTAFKNTIKGYYLKGIDLVELDSKRFNEIPIYNEGDILKKFLISIPYPNLDEKIESLIWDVYIKTNASSLSEIGFLIWSIGAIENINNVTTKVEEIGMGSFWFKIKVFFKDLIAKEETKEVLNKTKEAITSHYLNKPIAEVDKLESEKNKINKETELLNKEIINYDSPERKATVMFDIQGKQLDNKIKELAIEKQSIENKIRNLDYIEKLSTILLKGIISVDHVQVNINEALYILKNGDNIKLINDINLIDPENPEPTKDV